MYSASVMCSRPAAILAMARAAAESAKVVWFGFVIVELRSVGPDHRNLWRWSYLVDGIDGLPGVVRLDWWS